LAHTGIVTKDSPVCQTIAHTDWGTWTLKQNLKLKHLHHFPSSFYDSRLNEHSIHTRFV